jgi:hypothetical protein
MELESIAGLGSWTGWITSIELDNAVKYGYQFDIMSGYQFSKGELFSKFVLAMYELRLEYHKTHPMNLIAKLLMNSLYGKFGMKTEFTRLDVYPIATQADKVNLRKLATGWGSSIHDISVLGDKVLIIRDRENNLLEDQDPYHSSDVNIAVASFITASARVHMSVFRNNPDYNLYYSDTDSIVIDKPLHEAMVGSLLGQVKLEHVVERAVFLAPKVYGLVTVDGQEVIKVKGLTSEAASQLNVNSLFSLLAEDSSKSFMQEKWHKKLLDGGISVSEVAYTLKGNSNKRRAIYVEGYYTEPYHNSKHLQSIL